jgi:N-acetyl-1-D-myo-inositol-2-amino-2-deoxy-alpha-D-glucopyranoside deacetylase
MNKHLLLVHAQPDDQSIGQRATMARYAAEGVGVTLVTCTGGEMGEILVPGLEHLAAGKDDTLADQRKIEMDQATEVLGITDYRCLGGFKRFRDSGMQWHPTVMRSRPTTCTTTRSGTPTSPRPRPPRRGDPRGATPGDGHP